MQEMKVKDHECVVDYVAKMRDNMLILHAQGKGKQVFPEPMIVITALGQIQSQRLWIEWVADFYTEKMDYIQEGEFGMDDLEKEVQRREEVLGVNNKQQHNDQDKRAMYVQQDKKAENKKKIVCFNCNRKGHYARECRDKKDQTTQESSTDGAQDEQQTQPHREREKEKGDKKKSKKENRTMLIYLTHDLERRPQTSVVGSGEVGARLWGVDEGVQQSQQDLGDEESGREWPTERNATTEDVDFTTTAEEEEEAIRNFYSSWRGPSGTKEYPEHLGWEGEDPQKELQGTQVVDCGPGDGTNGAPNGAPMQTTWPIIEDVWSNSDSDDEGEHGQHPEEEEGGPGLMERSSEVDSFGPFPAKQDGPLQTKFLSAEAVSEETHTSGGTPTTGAGAVVLTTVAKPPKVHESALTLSDTPLRKTPLRRDKDESDWRKSDLHCLRRFGKSQFHQRISNAHVSSDWRKSDLHCLRFGKSQFHQRIPNAHVLEWTTCGHVRVEYDPETSTAPHDLCDTGHTLQMSSRPIVEIQVDSVKDDRSVVETRDEIMMMHENDVFVDVGHPNAGEQERYVTHMFHDMIPTQSMTGTMGGGDVVSEPDNNWCTPRVTEIVCDVGHCKQPQAQTGTCKCSRECGEDNPTLRSEQNNTINSNMQTNQHKQVGVAAAEEMCYVERGKPFRSQSWCCRAAVDINEHTYTPEKSADASAQAHQHTAHKGVGGGSGGVSKEKVGDERTETFPSQSYCCRDQSNPKEDPHKLANTQGECEHIYSHFQHTQGTGARSEGEALSRTVRSTTECCKDRTNTREHTHKQAKSQGECEHVYQHIQHMPSIGAANEEETVEGEFGEQGKYPNNKVKSETQTQTESQRETESESKSEANRETESKPQSGTQSTTESSRQTEAETESHRETESEPESRAKHTHTPPIKHHKQDARDEFMAAGLQEEWVVVWRESCVRRERMECSLRSRCMRCERLERELLSVDMRSRTNTKQQTSPQQGSVLACVVGKEEELGGLHQRLCLVEDGYQTRTATHRWKDGQDRADQDCCEEGDATRKSHTRLTPRRSVESYPALPLSGAQPIGESVKEEVPAKENPADPVNKSLDGQVIRKTVISIYSIRS
jgi:hypothetical protein